MSEADIKKEAERRETWRNKFPDRLSINPVTDRCFAILIALTRQMFLLSNVETPAAELSLYLIKEKISLIHKIIHNEDISVRPEYSAHIAGQSVGVTNSESGGKKAIKGNPTTRKKPEQVEQVRHSRKAS